MKLVHFQTFSCLGCRKVDLKNQGWLVVLVLLFMVGTARASAVRGCDAPVIRMEVLYQDAPVYNDASAQTLASAAGVAPDHPREGLYRSNQRVLVKADSKVLREDAQAPAICLSTLYISYAMNHVIHINSEHPPGSCIYQEMLAHERVHERIHVEQAQAASDYIKTQLSKAPLLFTGPTAAGDAQQWIQQTSDFSTQVYKRWIDAAQQRFDSPQEYARLRLTCRKKP